MLAGVLFACDPPKKEELKEPVMEKKVVVKLGTTRFEELEGYFVKNDVVLMGTINLLPFLLRKNLINILG